MVPSRHERSDLRGGPPALVELRFRESNRLHRSPQVELRYPNDTLIASYAFDGNSLRVVKVWGADRTFYLYAGTQLISEFEDAASNTYSAGTTPGQAPADTSTTMLYQHNDHLTTRLTTDNFGNLSNDQAHYPYGEQWYAGGTANPSVLRKFTSYQKEDEAATGKLNYAVYREQSARIGRFLIADPAQGNLRNPQRLNRYAYVRGDPISRTDRRGLDDTDSEENGIALMDLGTGIGSGLGETIRVWSGSTWFSVSALVGYGSMRTPGPSAPSYIGNTNQWIVNSMNQTPAEALRNPILPPGVVQVGPAQIIAPPRVPIMVFAHITYPNGRQVTLQSLTNIVRQQEYDKGFAAWQDNTFTGASSPIDLRFGTGSPATTTLSCSLQAQSGSSCSYNCSSGGAFPFPFSTTVDNLRTGCPGAGSLSQCPSSLQMSGLAGTTPDGARVTGCSP